MPTVAQNIRAKYSPHSSVNDQAIDSQRTSPSRRTKRMLKYADLGSADSVPKKMAPAESAKYSSQSTGSASPANPGVRRR